MILFYCNDCKYIIIIRHICYLIDLGVFIIFIVKLFVTKNIQCHKYIYLINIHYHLTITLFVIYHFLFSIFNILTKPKNIVLNKANQGMKLKPIIIFYYFFTFLMISIIIKKTQPNGKSFIHLVPLPNEQCWGTSLCLVFGGAMSTGSRRQQ